MKNKYFLSILILSISISFCALLPKKSRLAFVTVPVTDLIGNPTTSNKTSKHAKYCTYEYLPLESKGVYHCRRIHQLIFNEVVKVLEETKKELKIKVLHFFYSDRYGIKQATYWTRKKDFTFFEDLKKKNIPTAGIPYPIIYNQKAKNSEVKKHNIITLTYPFFDKTTNKTYSAGTRFVIAPIIFPITNPTHNPQNTIQVYSFDKKSFAYRKLSIPKNICTYNIPKSNTEKRKNFIRILKTWAHAKPGFIPYVAGGCSFTHLCNNNKLVPIQIKNKNETITFYTRPSFTTNPIPGFDCSSLVLRAAQICNIPYFYKNTVTLNKHLTKIKDIKDLQNGDLIFYKGHVVIISDIKNNKIIEAKTVKHGYGKVHEITLSEAFEGVRTYQDLFAFKKSKKILKRKDKHNKIVQNIRTFNFLKLI